MRRGAKGLMNYISKFGGKDDEVAAEDLGAEVKAYKPAGAGACRGIVGAPGLPGRSVQQVVLRHPGLAKRQAAVVRRQTTRRDQVQTVRAKLRAQAAG